jgi:flavin reductase (DIM6/NTAB) family NADH-FMN oxidoreductase RutF
MTREQISPENFIFKPMANWDGQGMLLTSGDFAAGQFNAMTVGWGSMGVMWGLPFVQVVVRPVRYTYQFMEKFETFTVCVFSEAYSAALDLLGNKSGRDGDKISEAGLTPIASSRVAAPGYAQADLVFECRKIYWDDLEKAHFLDPRLEKKYPAKDYHRMYYGEILAMYGTPPHFQVRD